jgi:hypothetical protein
MQKKDKGICKGLLYEYTNVLCGTNKDISTIFFKKGPSAQNEIFAIELLKYMFEIFLRWTPEDACARFDKQVADEMHVSRIIKYLPISDMEPDIDYSYIVHLVYPDIIPYDKDRLTIRIYKAILDDNNSRSKFPKGFFDGIDGRRKACVCFRYMIENYFAFDSIEAMYSFFSTKEGEASLNKYGLYLALKDVFVSPVKYLHETLPQDEKNDFLYFYYDIMYNYDRKAKYITAKEKKNNIKNL